MKLSPSHRPRIRRAGILLALPLGLLLSGQAALASPTTTTTPGVLVSDRVQACTPQISAGKKMNTGTVINDETVYAGGVFTSIVDCTGTQTYSRSNMVAYSTSTGAVTPFVANTSGEVKAVASSPDGKFVYVGGMFGSVNGVSVQGLAKLDAATGAVVTAFHSPFKGRVYSLAVANNRLYVGGTYSKKLVALDLTTGADTNTLNVTLAGNKGSAAGPLRVDKFAINPAGTDLVAIGPMDTVNGQPRQQAFRLSLGATSATLTDWHPLRFNVNCLSFFPYYLRNVAWAQDGSYFAIVSTGGPAGGYPATGFCDASAKWSASSAGAAAEPDWINWTGGDGNYSVAVDGAAHRLYVGGHPRWFDNPQGHDNAGPGAYYVESLGAINADTGLADRTWFAGRMDRGHAKEDLTLFSKGLIEFSDGHVVNGRPHFGTATFPKPGPAAMVEVPAP